MQGLSLEYGRDFLNSHCVYMLEDDENLITDSFDERDIVERILIALQDRKRCH